MSSFSKKAEKRGLEPICAELQQEDPLTVHTDAGGLHIQDLCARSL